MRWHKPHLDAKIGNKFGHERHAAQPIRKALGIDEDQALHGFWMC